MGQVRVGALEMAALSGRGLVLRWNDVVGGRASVVWVAGNLGVGREGERQ